jgi:hypothetical protein
LTSGREDRLLLEQAVRLPTGRRHQVVVDPDMHAALAEVPVDDAAAPLVLPEQLLDPSR